MSLFHKCFKGEKARGRVTDWDYGRGHGEITMDGEAFTKITGYSSECGLSYSFTMRDVCDGSAPQPGDDVWFLPGKHNNENWAYKVEKIH
jgi:hypothetical protein